MTANGGSGGNTNAGGAGGSATGGTVNTSGDAGQDAATGGDGVFLTSKVSPYDLGYDKCLESVKVRCYSSSRIEIL